MKTLFDIGDEIKLTLTGKMLEYSASANGDCYTIALTDTKSSGTRVYLNSTALRNAVRVDDTKSLSSDSNARLKDRTVNIIALTKRFNPGKDLMKALVKYLSEECDCSPDAYNKHVIFSIVKDAFMDYLFVAERSRACDAVRRFLGITLGDNITRMLETLKEIQIAGISDDGRLEFIDGWHSTDFTRKIGNAALARLWLNDAKKEENTNG